MSTRMLALASLFVLALGTLPARAQRTSLAGEPSYSWRHYRPGNTGILGDYNEALYVAPDGNPYIGGYDPFAEDGGFARFVQAEDRWETFSNVDYPVIGDPNLVGSARVSDIVPDAAGRLWMGTWRGALFFDPTVGASSLVNYGPMNSALLGGRTTDIDIAPDGSVWFAAISVSWGDGGIFRFEPATASWTSWGFGQTNLAVQPRAGGGYFVWVAPSYSGFVFRYSSATKAWTLLEPTGPAGQVAALPGKDCVDDGGNFWALRITQPGQFHSLDYQRPNGTWVSPPPPYAGVTFNTWAFKAFGNEQALLADGNGAVYRFDGTSWKSYGVWRAGGYTDALDIDAAGNVWVCGTGGAAKRDAVTEAWQRYRITNTGQFSNWNYDLALDPRNGYVYVAGNAGTGIGGMSRFDGERWFCFDDATYGLGVNWPFNNDDCRALTYRPSNDRVALAPYTSFYGIHEWNGSQFFPLQLGNGAVRLAEDSVGRLWALGEYYDLNAYAEGTWTAVPISGWGANVIEDPTRAATIWAATNYEVLRTDGSYAFSRIVDDFPELTPNSDVLTTVAPDENGVAWIGSNQGLFRIDADTGAYRFYSPANSGIPDAFAAPLAVSPDHRVWFADFGSGSGTNPGLCWFDGRNFGLFPVTAHGLPHAQIVDMEVRPIARGYELWISCLSRGVAVLTVRYPQGSPR